MEDRAQGTQEDTLATPVPLKLLCFAGKGSLALSLGPMSLAPDLPLRHVLALCPASPVPAVASLHQDSGPSLPLSCRLRHPELFGGQLEGLAISVQEEPNRRFFSATSDLYSLAKCSEEVTFISLAKKGKGGSCMFRHDGPASPATPSVKST